MATQACPNSCRHTENTQPTTTIKKHEYICPDSAPTKPSKKAGNLARARLFHRDHHVVLLSLAQEHVLAEKQIACRHRPLKICFTDVVHVNAAAFDVLSRLPLGRAKSGMD